jgi:hypothetical protein
MDVAWGDAKLLRAEPLTERLPGQLYAAVSSISAHLGEITTSRLNALEELRRLLLAIIPRERAKGTRPKR